MRRFFLEELARLRRNSIRLNHGLAQYALRDPRAAGQLELLEVQLRNYDLLVDLARNVTSLADLMFECRARYTRAWQAHQRTYTFLDDRWWRTLGQMQYFRMLNNRLKQLVQNHSADLHREEDEAPIPLDELHGDLQRLETLRGLAASHRTAQAHSYLTRD